jgi:DNA-directed RNA polymerase specialized sigma subunit
VPEPRKLAALTTSATTGTPTRGQEDLALWRSWKADPTDEHASALLRQVSPLIQREVGKWAGTLARPLLETESKRLAMQAFHSFDPSRGAQLGTHVVNQLRKLSRLSYTNQNVARLPENKMLQFHAYHVGHEKLQDELGRAPTTDELADHLGWSIGHLEAFRKDIGRKELLESGGTEGSEAGLHADDTQDHLVDFIHHDLPPMQKSIFEHLTGYRGAEVLSNQDIQKKVGLTQGQYSYAKARLLAHVEAVSSGKR